MSKHLCRNFLEFALSAQEREVAIQLATANRPRGWFRIRDIRDSVSIEQHSHLSAIITRLVKKGVLIRMGRGKYKFGDRELVKHITKEK